MEKIEGMFANHTVYQGGLALFRKVLACSDTANKFYTRLCAQSGKENITFRTSSALGDGTEGLTQMYVLKGGTNDVDIDTFDFTNVTTSTPRTLRITEGEFFPNKYDKRKTAATLLHEFLVHGMPFQTLFDSIRNGEGEEVMAAFWKKSRKSDNSGYKQHALYGEGKTPELDEILNGLGQPKNIGISNEDATAILAELKKDIAYHKKNYQLEAA